MKRILFIAILSILGSIALQSCYNVAENEKAAIEWLRNAKKPIICKMSVYNGMGNTQWTLIDSNINVYQTGWTNFNLPDTIK